MARATTKTDLVMAANEQFEKLWKIVETMNLQQQELPFSKKMATMGKETHWSRDKNMRDVFVHLYKWHHLLLSWIDSNLKDSPKPFLPEPYNWRNYSAMNIEFWKKHQNTTLSHANNYLKKVMKR